MKGLHVLKALIQRVAEASVKVEENHVGRIGPGLLILLGINKSDELKDCEWLTNKIANLRIFPGDKTNFDQFLLKHSQLAKVKHSSCYPDFFV